MSLMLTTINSFTLGKVTGVHMNLVIIQ